MPSDYTTVEAVKNYLHITSAGDDVLLASLVTRASRMIDDHSGRVFVGEEATRRYDALGPHLSGRLLLLDADLLEVTGIINGDGSAIPLEEVLLRPLNWPPYFAISIRQGSSYAWNYLDDPEGALQISGSWGYSMSAPEPVQHAATRLAAWLYRQRDTGAEAGEIELTERGVSIAPARLPRDVLELLRPYQRLMLRMVA